MMAGVERRKRKAYRLETRRLERNKDDAPHGVPTRGRKCHRAPYGIRPGFTAYGRAEMIRRKKYGIRARRTRTYAPVGAFVRGRLPVDTARYPRDSATIRVRVRGRFPEGTARYPRDATTIRVRNKE